MEIVYKIYKYIHIICSILRRRGDLGKGGWVQGSDAIVMRGRLQARETAEAGKWGGRRLNWARGVGPGALSTHIYIERKPIYSLSS